MDEYITVFCFFTWVLGICHQAFCGKPICLMSPLVYPDGPYIKCGSHTAHRKALAYFLNIILKHEEQDLVDGYTGSLGGEGLVLLTGGFIVLCSRDLKCLSEAGSTNHEWYGV